MRILTLFLLLCLGCSQDPVVESYERAETWFLNNIKDKGVFVYRYDPETDKYPDKNNMIRQLMASRLLAELSTEDSALLSVHKKNLQFIFRYWYKERDELGYIYYNKKSKLGANAMALRTLVYSPYFSEYLTQAKKLADGILSLMDPDGSFEPWFVKPSYEYDRDYLLTFYSGEAILSLIEYAMKTRQDMYLDAAITSQEFYITKYVRRLKDNYYPAYVPWHTMSLSKLYKLTGRADYAQAIFRLNDELLKLQSPLGRFYKSEYEHYGKPHSSSDGVYTESLAYALEIAKHLKDDSRRARYEDAISLSVTNLLGLQYVDSGHKIDGAFRINSNNRRTRIDCTQHVMDAYRKIMAITQFPLIFNPKFL